MKSRRNQTPLRAAFLQKSALLTHIKDGMGAIESSHHEHFHSSIRPSFSDSIDIDKAFLSGHEQENRWDYLLGHTESNKIIGVEPHPATNGEISTVISKVSSAKNYLSTHLREKKSVHLWIWVASGKNNFLPIDKKTIFLAQKGIKFIGGPIKKKDLD